jgi:hypothetical protein
MADLPAPDRRHARLLTATLAPSFYLTEWLLVAATASAFAWLRARGWSEREIWLLFWGANLLVSGGLILCNDLLRIDLTLMRGLRRLTETARRHNRWVGLVLEGAVCVRLLFWDGPCQLLIYCRQRLPSGLAQTAFCALASAIQTFVWTKVFILGGDGLGVLLQFLNGGPP